jgi:sodium/bile acid cotransporter 7
VHEHVSCAELTVSVFPARTKSIAATLKLPKVGSFFLLVLIWSVPPNVASSLPTHPRSIFCNQFDQKAFELVSPQSIVLVVFLNLVLYLVFTALCVVLTRLPFLPPLIDTDAQRTPKWRRVATAARFGKPESTAICFCAAAKGLVVGSPILSILYGGMSPAHRAIISIPLVLYQGEQLHQKGKKIRLMSRRTDRLRSALDVHVPPMEQTARCIEAGVSGGDSVEVVASGERFSP